MPLSEENKLLPFNCPHCGVSVRITNEARHLRYVSFICRESLSIVCRLRAWRRSAVPLPHSLISDAPLDAILSFFREQHGIEPTKPAKKTDLKPKHKHVCDDVTLCGCGTGFLQKSLLDKHLLTAMQQVRPSPTEEAQPAANEDKEEDDAVRPKKKQAVEFKAPEEDDMMSYIAATLCAIQNQQQPNEPSSSSSSSSNPAVSPTSPEHAARIQAIFTKYAQAARIRSLQCLTLEAKLVEVEQQMTKFRAALASARTAHVAELSNVETATAQLVLHGVPLPSVALLQPAKNTSLGKPPSASSKKRARSRCRGEIPKGGTMQKR